MSTNNKKSNKNGKQPNKLKQAMAKASAKRQAVQPYSQKQFTVAGGQKFELDDAKQCELEYAAAKLAPFEAKENPCSLGYKNIPSIVIKKHVRGTFYSGGSTGDGFVAVNPYLALAEDVNSIAFSKAGYTGPDFDIGNANAGHIHCTGGVFDNTDLKKEPFESGAVSGRVISAAIRFKPIGNAVNTGGMVLTRQVTSGGEVLTTTKFPLKVTADDALSDLTKPIFNITNDGEWTTIQWFPLTVVEGDLVPNEYFDGTDITSNTRGACLWLAVHGAPTTDYPYVFEVVVICEYLSLKKALGLAKPSHQNQSFAAWIDTLLQGSPTTHGNSKETFDAVNSGLSKWFGISLPAAASMLMSMIAPSYHFSV